MTFTEAAVEVLRLVAKPLHYKKITEIAIERNLLSHVGKTPEVTMSSRLATMVRKDRGEAPIIKVKPGVFGLREFSKEVLDAAQHESGHDYELPKEPADAKGEAKGDESAQKKGDAGKGDAGKGDAESSAEKGDDDEKKKAEAKESPKLPGAEMFPEEEDDDEPILAKIESGGGDDDDEPKRRGKRRRRRRRKDDDDKRSGGRGGKSDDDKSDDGGGSKRGGRSRRSRGGKGRDRSSSSSSRSSRSSRDREAAALQGEWEREPGDGDLGGKDLVDAIEASLGGRKQTRTLSSIAESLVKRGRLSGDPSALAPTLAAAVRGDEARRVAEGGRPRFRLRGESLELVEWALTPEIVRAEDEALKAAERQRELVRRVFVRRLSSMPAAGLLELIASWLNAEGVVGVRGVHRADASPGEFHLAGTLRRGPLEIPLAITVLRDANLSREKVVEVRGALHHYGNAQAAWLLGLGSVLRGAQEEAAVESAGPIALFGGNELAEAMERAGVGVVRTSVTLSCLDLDLLDDLTGPGRSTPVEDEDSDDDDEDDDSGKKRRRRRRRGGRGRKRDDDESKKSDDDSSGSDDDGDDSDDDDDGSKSKSRRRRRRRKKRSDDAKKGGGSDDEGWREDPDAEIDRRRRREEEEE